jgi:16S rRNA processing protein RimM
MSSDGGPAWLRAGRVGKPHGLDGSFHVSEAKPRLLDAGRTLVVAGRPVRVAHRKGSDARPIIQLEDIRERAAVEPLRGQALLAARRDAPQLEDDEWWEEELEGCAVCVRGRTVGVVRRLVALPSCEALEVERADGGEELLVPLVVDAVRRVDVERREIEIDLDFLGEGS